MNLSEWDTDTNLNRAGKERVAEVAGSFVFEYTFLLPATEGETRWLQTKSRLERAVYRQALKTTLTCITFAQNGYPTGDNAEASSLTYLAAAASVWLISASMFAAARPLDNR